jgi:hypothetical protein
LVGEVVDVSPHPNISDKSSDLEKGGTRSLEPATPACRGIGSESAGERIRVISMSNILRAVLFINKGFLKLAVIKPIPPPEQLPPSRTWPISYCSEDQLPNGSYILHAEATFQVKQQLGEDWTKYVIPYTVHGSWKAKKHQGLIFPVIIIPLTVLANPNKPIPSRQEIEELYQKLLPLIQAQEVFS